MSSSEATSRFLRSTGASVFSQAWRVTVTFGTMLLLRRLIPAADYGLWTWALPVFMILGAVRDLGLVYHVVRVKPRPYGNLLALELVWGGGLVLLTVAAAPLLGLAYHDPFSATVPVLRALALFLFFEGLSTVPRVYFEGELEIGRAVVPELARNLCLAITSIGLAYLGHGVWSLVWGQVAASGLYALLLWLRAWGRMPLLFQRGETLRLVRESLPLALIWFLIILVRYVDPLILGSRFLSTTVANYGFAYENAFRISEIAVPALGRAVYPALVAFATEAKRLFQTYTLATVLLLGIEVPTALFLFSNAELVLRLLGGEQWVEAPTYFRILCFAPLADPFSRLGGEVLKVRRLDRLWILSSSVTLATFIFGGLVAIHFLGPVGMAWINLVPLGGLVMAWALYRVAPRPFLTLLRDLAFVYLVPVPIFVVAHLAAGDRPLLRMALGLVALGLSLLVLTRRFGAGFVAFFRHPDPDV